MARPILQIYNDLVTQKQSASELASLTPQYSTPDNPYLILLAELSSSSKVSIWRLWLFVIACGHYTLEVMMDVFRVEAEDIARRNIFGTQPWYADKVLKFQYGYSPVWNNSTFTYDYTDTTSTSAVASRVVSKVSVIEATNMAFNSVLIKAAKEPTLGTLAPLTGAEVTSLNTYINRIKPPGIKTTVQSYPADLLRLKLKLWYDGVLDVPAFQTRFETALKQFLKDIPFDGILRLDDLIIAIRAVSGVVNVQLQLVEAKASYDPSFTSVTQERNPASGYFELVPIGFTPSDTQIEFIPV